MSESFAKRTMIVVANVMVFAMMVTVVTVPTMARLL